ncbi:hypothetical protein NKH48_03350 [Mesorhizobium sp. M1233]|uniref:hypothetical protein n=1 Tax=Mesorhizobium sp. M1233 TaxID=2957072 RepID=UPI00333A487B
MCWAHYHRLRRYGDPLAGRTPDGEPERYLREVVLTYEGDECLTWPYGRSGNGYGKLRVNGRKHIVSRLACEHVHGPAPTPEHEAAHSCGKGHLACVTKGHLSWKTAAANQADRLIHGTHCRGESSGRARLTEPEVRQIIALKGIKPIQEIAAQLGVSRRHVRNIHDKKRWAWLWDEAAA